MNWFILEIIKKLSVKKTKFKLSTRKFLIDIPLG